MPIRGEAVATLAGGRQLTLKINFATLARVAAQVGVPAGEVFSIIESEEHPMQMLVALAVIEWALKRNHPEIDEDALGDLMLDEADAKALIMANKIAMIGAFGPQGSGGKDGENPPKPKAKRGTGTRSKGNGRKRG